MAIPRRSRPGHDRVPDQKVEVSHPLTRVLVMLMATRYFVLFSGVAFMLWHLVEVLWLNNPFVLEDLVEIIVFSIIGPALIWPICKLGEGFAKAISESHRKLLAASRLAQHEIEQRRNTEEALRRSELESRALAQESELIARVGQIISSTLDIDLVYERFAEEVRRLIPFDRVNIGIVDLERNVVTIAYASGVDVPERKRGRIIPLEGTISAEVVRRRSGILLQGEDIQDLAERFPGLVPSFKAGLKSVLAVPLFSNDRPVGALQFRSVRGDAYTQQHLRLAERVGNQIAGAVANALLHGSLQREARRREVLAEISRIISSSLDISDVYEPFAQQVRQLIPFDRISINIVDPGKDTFTSAYTSGIDVPGRQPGNVASLAGSTTLKVVETRKPLLVQGEDEQELARKYPALVPNLQAGLRSFLSVPLISKNDIFGVLHLRSTRPNAYTTEDVVLAEQIGTQIAGVIASALLYSDLKEAQEKLRQSEENYRHMVEEASDVVYTTSADGNFTYVNPVASRLTGYSEEELLGMHFSSLVVPEWRQRVRRFYLRQAARKAQETHLEFPILTRSGETRWIDQTVTLFVNSDGNVTGFQGIARDVTQRKRVEQEREQLIHDLQDALAKIKTLSGLLPICANCKKIRDDNGYWNQIEAYIRKHSYADFSHSLCPDCARVLYADLYKNAGSPRSPVKGPPGPD